MTQGNATTWSGKGAIILDEEDEGEDPVHGMSVTGGKGGTGEGDNGKAVRQNYPATLSARETTGVKEEEDEVEETPAAWLSAMGATSYSGLPKV